MTIQELYTSGILEAFSTYTRLRKTPEGTRQEAQVVLLAFLATISRKNVSSATQLTSLLQRTLDEHQASPQVESCLTQFVHQYPPHQAGILLHQYLLALTKSDCSVSTIKNYRSDINQFFTFSEQTEIEKSITKTKVQAFARLEREHGRAHATIKRKLISLTQFALWLERMGAFQVGSFKWLEDFTKSLPSSETDQADPGEKIQAEKTRTLQTPHYRSSPKHTWHLPVRDTKDTHAPVLSTAGQAGKGQANQEYRNRLASGLAHLQSALSSQNKRSFVPYLNVALMVLVLMGLGFFGYRQFFTEPDSPLAYPSSLTRPNRTLSFQGRLTDTAQNPITSATDFRFKLYDSGPSTTGGTVLWDSTTCAVTPDQDGIFATGLGDDCGSEIGQEVFSENSNVWLEVEVEGETLDPRQSIKTVAYALNSETLQGYPASASAVENTVLVMNNSGEVVLGNSNPVLKATGDSFAIEAETLTLRTSAGSDGDIVLAPDGLGTVIAQSYLEAPGATLSATYAEGTSLVLRGGPSGTANIQEWQNSAGGVLSVVDENGNIGIGTSDPTRAIEIEQPGDGLGIYLRGFDDQSSDYFNTFISASGNTALLASGAYQMVGGSFMSFDSGGDIYMKLPDNTGTYKLRLRDDTNTDVLTIDSNGKTYIADNVGIGTTNPSSFKLQIAGDIGPQTDATYDLGSASLAWDNIYGTTLYQNGNVVCDTSGNCTGNGLWANSLNVFHPKNEWASVVDLAVGGTSTASADILLQSDGDAYFSGSVGIGTTSPETSLNVVNSDYRQAALQRSGSNQKLWLGSVWDSVGSYVGNNAYYTSSFNFKPNYTSASGVSFRNTGAIEFWADSGLTAGVDYNPTERMTILSTGSVGIGTTNPNALFHVSGTSSEIARISGDSTNAAWLTTYQNTNRRLFVGHASTSGAGIASGAIASAGVIRADAGLHLLGGSSATTGLTVLTNGNVGIGITNPNTKLYVAGDATFRNSADSSNNVTIDSGSTAAQNSVLAFADRGTTYFSWQKPSGNTFQLWDHQNSTSRLFIQAGANSSNQYRAVGTGDHSFLSGSTEIVTFTDGGNVGIGTTDATSKLTVQQNGAELRLETASSPGVYYTNLVSNYNSQERFYLGNGGGKYFGHKEINSASAGTEAYVANYYGLGFVTGQQDPTSAGIKMFITQSGNVGIGTTNPSAKIQVAGDAYFNLGEGFHILDDANYYGSNLDARIIRMIDGNGSSGNVDGGITFERYTSSDTTADDVLTLRGTGNVGVGITNPSYKLDIDGDARIASGSDLYIGSIGLNDVGTSRTTSGASLVGTYDEFAYSNGLNVQDVLDDLDQQIASIVSGSAGAWTDAGSYLHPTNGEVLGNSASAGSNKIAGLYLADSSPLVFGTDNDVTFNFSGSVLGITTGSNDINFDSNTLYIDGSTNRVGIGSTAPTETLTVSGNIDVSGNDTRRLRFRNAADNDHASLGILNGGLALSGASGHDSSPHIFINNSGNVGIGTTNPNNLLTIESASPIIQLQGSSANQFESGRIRFAEDDTVPYQGGFIHYDGSANVFNIGVNNATSLGDDNNAISILRSNGNVGVGTTNPEAVDGGAGTKLHVDAGTGSSGNVEVARFEGGSDADNTYGVLRVTHGNDRGFFVKGGRAVGNTDIAIMGTTNNAGTMTDILTLYGGNVGIGTTNPQKQLSLLGGAGTIGQIRMGWSDASSWTIGRDNVSTGRFSVVHGTGTDEKLSITTGGSVGIGNTNPGNNLDINTNSTTSGISLDSRVALSGHNGDTWLRLNQSGSWTSGIYTPGDLRADGELRAGNTDYGSYKLQTTGSAYINDYLLALGGINVGGTSDPGTGAMTVNSVPLDFSFDYDNPIYFAPQAYFEAESPNTPEGHWIWNIDGFTEVNNTTVPFSKVALSSTHDQLYSDYIPVQPGETLYGEIWAMRQTGASGTAGTVYYGIEQYDKDLNPISTNNGTAYFVASTETVSTNSTWTKYSGTHTLPTSHTPYSGSDGGPVRYVRVRVLVNYNAGTIPTHWGGVLLRRQQLYRDAGDIATGGNLRIASGSDLFVGAIGLNDTGSSNTTSGASLIGTYDEFAYSNSSTVQDVLDDLDAQIASVIGGGIGVWTDVGNHLYPTNDEYIGNEASGTSSQKIAGLYLADSAPLVFGNDNDISYSFSGSVLGVTTGSNDINFDSDTLFIDGSANQIGIGTNNPSASLDIASGEVPIEFDNGGARITIHDGYGNFNIKTGVDQDNVIDDGTTGGTHFRMDSNGYAHLWVDESTTVGGSFSADAGLTINGGVVDIDYGDFAVNGTTVITSSLVGQNFTQMNVDNLRLDGNTLSATDNGGVYIYDNASNGMFVQDGGNVGIGVTNPSAHLEVESDAYDNILELTRTGQGSGYFKIGTTGYPLQLETSSSKDIQFIPGGTTTMTVASTGSVGIGTTSPDTKLHVDGGGLLIGTNGSKAAAYISSRVDRISTDNSSGTVWYKFATLPATSGGAGGMMNISFAGGRYASASKLSFDMIVSNRDSFVAQITNVSGGNMVSPAGIVIYQEGDGSYSLYIKLTANEYSGGQVSVQDGSWYIGPTYIDIVDGSPSNTSTPAGTLVFDSTDNSYFANAIYNNYGTGNVGIGLTNPSYKLDVNGDLRIASGSDLYIGSIGLNDVGTSRTTSGASLVGTYDEFAYSNSSTVQDVLDDLDAQIASVIGGGSGVWTDTGNHLYPTGNEYIGNEASGTSSQKITGLYLADSADLAFGNSNDVAFNFSGSVLGVTTGNSDINFDSNTLYIDGSANKVGVGTNSPNANLDIAGSGKVIDLDGGGVHFTVHDGYGNFNIKTGVDNNNLIDDGTTGGTHFRMDSNGYAHLWVDESTTVGGSFSADAGLTINGGVVDISYGNFAVAGTTVITSSRVGQNFTQMNVDNLRLDGNTLSATDNGGVYIYDNASNGMFVQDGGNVGINTTTPGEKLDVNGDILVTAGSTDVIRFNNTNSVSSEADIFIYSQGVIAAETNLYQYAGAGNYMVFGIGGQSTSTATEYMRLDSTGNLGIGVTNPSAHLEVESNAYDNILELTRTGQGSGYFKIGTTGYPLQLETSSSKDIQFIPGGTTTMTVASTGSVGIGVTNPGETFDVDGTARVQPGGRLTLANVPIVEGDTQGGTRVYRNLANFESNSNTETGAIVIDTGVSPGNQMSIVTLKGYMYSGSTHNVDIDINSYFNSNGTSWSNRSFVNKGDYEFSNVRIGTNGSGNVVIVLGDTADTHSYPKLWVEKWLSSHSSGADSDADNWAITFETSLSGYTLATVDETTYYLADQRFVNVTGDTMTGGLTVPTNGLTIGSIGLHATGASNSTSGASRVGTYDEFTYSNSSTVQDVLDDLDYQISTLTGANVWTDAGSYVYPTNGEAVQITSTGGATNPLYIAASTGSSAAYFREDSSNDIRLQMNDASGTSRIWLDTRTSAGSYFNAGNFSIGTSSYSSNKLRVESNENAESFYFYQANGTTGERDVFTIEDADTGGGGQDESSTLKVLRSGAFSAGDDGSSLLELTYTGGTADPDEQFYMLGRTTDEGSVNWGISITDSDFWTTGSIRGGATGTGCGATDAACFNSPSFAFEASGNSYINGGNLGIGSTSPGSELDIASSQPNLRLTNTNTGSNNAEDIYSSLDFYSLDSDHPALPGRQAYIQAVHTRAGTGHTFADAGLTFGVTNTSSLFEAMRITSDGSVGIGSTNPGNTLDVVGTAKISSGGSGGPVSFSTPGGASGMSMINTNRADIRFDNSVLSLLADAGTSSPAATSGLTINTNGSVGIGVGNASSALEVDGVINFTNTSGNLISHTAQASYDKIRVWNSNLYTIGMNSSQSFGYLNDYAMTFTMNPSASRGFLWRDSSDAASDGAMSLTTDGRLTVKSTSNFQGSVGIGNISAPSTYLDVNGTGSGTNSLQLRSGNGAFAFDSNQILLGYNGTATYRHAIKSRANGGSDAGNSIDFFVWDQGTDATGTIGTKHVMSLNGGNVGIGTTDPDATFKVNTGSSYLQLKVTGDTLTLADAGSANKLPYIEWRESDGGTRAFYQGWGNTSGTKWIDMRLENSYNLAIQGGNVGIGTTSTVGKLGVFDNTNSGPVIRSSFTNGSQTEPLFQAYLNSSPGTSPTGWDFYNWYSNWGPVEGGIRGQSANGWGTQIWSAQDIGLNAGGFSASAPMLQIETTGNIGIGVTNPTAKLQIGNNVGANGFDGFNDYQILLYNSGSASSSFGIGIESGTMSFNSSANYNFYSGGSSNVYFKSNGSVGIGTTDPAGKIGVYENSGTTSNRDGADIYIRNATSITSGSFTQKGIDVESIAIAGNTTSGQVWVSGGEFTASNTPTTSSGGYSRISMGVQGIAYGNTQGSSTSYGTYGIGSDADVNYGAYGYASGAGTTNWGIYCFATGTGGTNQCGGNQGWTVSSDRRIKRDIQTIENPIDIVTNLRGVTFYKTDDGSIDRKVGFIAQEVEPYLPEVVRYDSNSDFYTMDYSAITSVLTEAFKEHYKQTTAIRFSAEGDVVIQGSNGSYTATRVASNSPVTGFVTAANIVSAKITAGLTTTKQLIVQNSAQIASLSVNQMNVAGQTLDAYVKNIVWRELNTAGSAQVASGSAQFVATGSAQLDSLIAETATISGSLAAIDFSAQKTQLGSLLAENATISGTLVAENLEVAGSTRLSMLEAQQAQLDIVRANTAELLDATVSGTLYANNISGLEDRIAQTLQKPNFLDVLLRNDEPEPVNDNPIDIYTVVESAGYEINPDLMASAGATLAFTDGDVMLNGQAAYVQKYLQVNGLAYVADSLGVGNSLFVGNSTQISDGLIAYTPTAENDTLRIQPSGQGKLEFLAGLMTLEDGQVTITGNFYVAGTTQTDTLLTNLVQPADFGNPFQVQVAGVSSSSGQLEKSRFEIINELGTPVATISAEGKAAFAGGIGVGSESISSPDVASGSAATVTASKTSGKAVLKAGSPELIIENEQITAESLIYVTPVGSTQNQVLYVKSQTAEDTGTSEKEGKFTVGFDQAITSDVSFNWWIVN